MGDESVNTEEGATEEEEGTSESESTDTKEGTSAFFNGTLDGDIDDDDNDDEEGEAGETETETDDSSEEAEVDDEADTKLKTSIPPELMENKQIKRFIKDGVLDVGKLAESFLEGQKQLRNQVPENYEIQETMDEHSLTWDSDEQRDQFIAGAKEARMSQEAIDFALKQFGERMAIVRQQIGPLLEQNVAEERKAVLSEWGSEGKQRYTALREYAEKHPEIALMFNLRTREGTFAAYDYYTKQLGPDLVDSGGPAPVEDLQAELNTITSNPNYWNDPKLQKQATDISKRIERAAKAKG